jgi:hypothetical protein
MNATDQRVDQSQPVPSGSGLRWRIAGLAAVAAAVLVLAITWLVHRAAVGNWLTVHLGLDDLSGSWYGFWSGFGSDLAELGLIGAVATGVYQIVRKYNCHEPGCWRVGTHPAANGQFLLCYRHHPDFNGRKPTHETIERLHREHLARSAAFHEKIDDLHAHLGPTLSDTASAGTSDAAAPSGTERPARANSSTH